MLSKFKCARLAKEEQGTGNMDNPATTCSKKSNMVTQKPLWKDIYDKFYPVSKNLCKKIDMESLMRCSYVCQDWENMVHSFIVRLVKWQDGKQNSALMYAAAGGHVAIAKILLDNGADPNSQNWMSEVPLHSAANKGRLYF